MRAEAISLMQALQAFEVAEANLAKLERLWADFKKLDPTDLQGDDNPDYEIRRREYIALLEALPAVDGWKPDEAPADLDDVRIWLSYAELNDDPASYAAVDGQYTKPGSQLREYRFQLDTKRRALIRDSLINLIDQIDNDIALLSEATKGRLSNEEVAENLWVALRTHINDVDSLLGSSVSRPPRWSDLRRHIAYAMVGDLDDIKRLDWPNVKAELRKGLYGANEPIPSPVQDLGSIVSAKPQGPIATELRWSSLDAEGFERLIFNLILTQPSFQNPTWLTPTNAQDHGRDLQVTLVQETPFFGTSNERVIIQCKHWIRKTVGVPEIMALLGQMTLWSDPPVARLVIATSGRFSNDTVHFVEAHNAKGTLPKIDMWPVAHLEMLLARHPDLIAEARLR